MDIVREDRELRARLKARIEQPSFSTVFFAGAQAGVVGFLTRRWTKGLFRGILSTASDQLLSQARRLYSQLPDVAREVIPAVVSPFQLLTYNIVSEQREPQQKPSKLWYIPAVTAGQLAQFAGPRFAQKFAQRALTPEFAEMVLTFPDYVSNLTRRYAQRLAEQYRTRRATGGWLFGLAGFIRETPKILNPEFWEETAKYTRERLIQKYQQGALQVLDIQQQISNLKLKKEQAQTVAQAVYEEVRRRLESVGESQIARYRGLKPVTVGELKGMPELADIIARASRFEVKPGKNAFYKQLEKIRSKLGKEWAQKFAELPVGYGFYHGETATVLLPTQKLLLLDKQFGVMRTFHIPYLSFNPLKLFVPPSMEASMFGETVRVVPTSDVVPTLLGQMNQGDAQKLQQLQSLWSLNAPKISIPEELMTKSRQLHEMLRNAYRLTNEQVEKARQLAEEIVKDLESQNIRIEARRLMVAGRQPISLYNVISAKKTVRAQQPVQFMRKGYLIPSEAAGSGIFRQYVMQTGTATPRRGSDIAFSQQYNLQPNLLQKIVQGVQQAFTGQPVVSKLKAIAQYGQIAEERQPFIAGHVMETIGEQIAKLRASGFFEKYSQQIDLSKFTEQQIVDIYLSYFRGLHPSMESPLAQMAQKQLGTLEPSEQAAISELLSYQTRHVINEEWLSRTVKAQGRTRRQILQDVLFAYKLLTEPEKYLEQIEEEPVRRTLKMLTDVYRTVTNVPAEKKPSQAQKEQYETIKQFLEARETKSGLEELAELIRKETAGVGQLFEPELPEPPITESKFKYLYIPSWAGQEELIQYGIRMGWLEQLMPGITARFSDIGKRRGLITEPGLMTLYFAYRPVELIETLGLGGLDFTKITNQYDVLKRVFTRKILPVMAGITQLASLDVITGIGTLGWGILGNLYVGGIGLLNLVGIGPLGRYVHTHAPSLLSTLGQAYGMYGLKSVEAQFLLGQFGQLIERTPTTKEQQLQQEGVQLVEKRKAAGWEFGRGPYWGSRTQYYRPFLPYLYEKEWQFSENVYGSKLEYMAFGFPFPNPFNLFGLTWLIDPYHYEKKLWRYRPYPVSGPMPFTEIPILGPLLTPLSYLMKPPLNLASTQEMVQQQTGQYGFSYMAAQREYLQTGNLAQFDVAAGAFGHIGFGKQLTDYLGIIGFQTTQFTGAQFAGEQEYYEPKLQHSGMWGSVERLYYMAKLGNIFGLSEFIRRMIPHEEAGYPQFNPLVNPYLSRFEWLPDRYKTGDQYATMDFGEVRLPGPQYEKTRIMIDRYGPIDQFLIIQNVQPYSRQYEQMKSQILSMLEANPQAYSELTKYLIQQQIENAEKVRQGIDIYRKVYTEGYQTMKVQLSEYIGNGMFTVPGKTYLVRIHGAIEDELKLAYEIYRKTGQSLEEQFRQARQIQQQIEQQYREYEGKEVELRVFKDEMQRFTYTESGELILEAGLPGLNVPHIAREYEHPLSYQTNGANFLRWFWDIQSSFVPEAFIFEKFFAYRDPLELYVRYSVYGKYRMLWHRVIQDIIVPNFNILRIQNPISAFLGGLTTGSLMSPDAIESAIYQVTTGLMYAGQSLLPNYVPGYTEKRWEFEEQMHYLQFLQDTMRGSRPNSLLGIKSIQGYSQLEKNVPLEYKQFIPHMVNQPSHDIARLRTILPDYVRDVLEQTYQAKMEAIRRQEEGRTLNFRTQVQHQIEDVNVEEYLEELGDYLEYVDLRQYRQLLQLDKFSDTTQISITPQMVYQQLVSTQDQQYLQRQMVSTQQFNTEYMRQIQQSHEYAGTARVFLTQSRMPTRYNYFVRY